ncbi:MAG: hypothetical protein JO199_07025, partial [Candidatus Eremiobacteraeota bacterium]|nr:hypothetical protein [Candidatus Eremiobacteraeota bacterium]
MSWKEASLIAVLAFAACSGGGASGGLPPMAPQFAPPVASQGSAAQIAPHSTPQRSSHMRASSASAASISLTGTVVGQISGGFTLYSKGCGNVHVMTSSRPPVGSTVKVTGTGSCASSIDASSVNSSSGGGSGPNHVLTEDYLGKPYGTTSISWSSAAPHVT